MSKTSFFEKIARYGIAIAFLSLEVFAFISFSFGNSFLLFAILSTAIAVLLLVFYFIDIRKNDFASTAFFIFPLFIFALLVALGVYMKGHRIIDGDFSLSELVFIPIGIVAIAFSGYVLSISKDFKIKHFLIVIYSGIALLTIINLVANLINFGPFYTIIYKGYHMYYAGLRSSLTVEKIAYTLEGFKIIESSINHYLLYPVILLSSNLMLFNVSPKKEKVTFYIYLSFVVIALLAIVFVPTTLGLLFIVLSLVIDGVIILYTKVKCARKPINYVVLAILIVLALILLALILVNQDNLSSLRNVVAGNSLLNRIFITNGYVSPYAITLQNIIGENFLGHYSYTKNQYLVSAYVAPQSGSFIFDSFLMSGVIGAICLFVFVFVGFKRFQKYFVLKSDEYKYQVLLLNFLFIFFIYIGLFYDGEYGIYYSINKPFFMSGPFLISVFMMTYVYTKTTIKKKESTIEVEEAKQVEVNEENEK